MFLLLRPLVFGVVRDFPELILASRVSLSSLAKAKSNLVFSTKKAWILSIWLDISRGVLSIVSGSQYWRSCLSSSCLLDNWEKRGKAWGFCLKEFFGGSCRGYGGRK